MSTHNFLNRYSDFIINHNKSVIFAAVLFVMSLMAGVTQLTFTSDFRAYFGPENPQLKVFEEMEKNYSKQENIFFYIEAKQGNIFTSQGLQLIEQITEQSWQLPHSQRVTSLQNYQHTDVEGDELLIDYLFQEADSLTPKDIQILAAKVATITAIKPQLISNDGHATGVSVRIILPEDDIQTKTNENQAAMKQVVLAARKMSAQFSQAYPQFEVRTAGSLTSTLTMGEAIEQDIRTLLLISYGIMIAVMLILLRTFSGMLLTLLIISFSVISTMGLFGWLGFSMTPPTGFVPTAIMTIAVADTIHILVSYYFELQQGLSKKQAIKEAMRINFSPVFITSITTIIGVLALNTSDSPPYRDMGNMIAVGVFMAWFFTITFLPAMLTLLPAPKGKMKEKQQPIMGRVANMVIKHHLFFFFLLGGIIIAAATQVNKNQLTERWHEFYDDSFPISQATEKINQNLAGLHRIFFELSSGEQSGINNPDYLLQMDQFKHWLEQQPQVAHVSALSTTVKELNKNLHGAQAQWNKVPESRELAAQYLLLYELSLPMGLGLDDTINNDRSASRVVLSLHRTDSAYILEIEERARQWLSENAPALKLQEGTGLDIVFANLSHRNITTMIEGTSIALVLISMLLIFALRSVKIGFISLIPNIMPAILAYGIWGIYQGYIDSAVSVVVCLSLGIVVDDTVHFLSKYQRAKQEQGLSTENAIRYAFQTVGNALIVTSMVLVGGFAVMQWSHFIPSTAMGALLAITIFVALLIDFLFLPPLLMLLDKTKGKNEQQVEGK